MTSDQRNIIDRMRSQGRGYKYIAAETGLSENTVKSYCRRALAPAIKPIVESSASAAPAPAPRVARVAAPAPVPKPAPAPAPTLAPVPIKDGGSRTGLCRWCGKPVKQTPGRKEKKFCSEACRVSWWNRNRNSAERKVSCHLICPTCHTPFSAYGDPRRKYCSRACYLAGRFYGGAL